MSSTNKTTNYELSQFIGSDKPAWLADYNQDMSRIDSGIHTAKLTADGADAKADANTTLIGSLDNLTTDTKSSVVAAINEVDSHADTAQNTANSATAGINNLASYLNMTIFTSATQSASDNGTVVNTGMKYASNSAGTLGKIYGYIDVRPSTAKNTVITLTDKAPFRPQNDIFIESLGIVVINEGYIGYPVDAKIETDGTIKLYCYMEGLNKIHRLIIHPCLLFIKDFGDQPSSNS